MSVHRFFLSAIGFSLMLAAQAVSAAPVPQAATGNLAKEILDHKDAIQWRSAPDAAVPADVCTMFQACTGPMKFVTLPAATEGGTKVGRGLFWTPAGPKQKTDAFILEHQTYSDVYFFLMSPDGNLLKTAYKAPGKTWVSMGNGIAQPTFDKNKQAWHAWVIKMGSKPAAPKAAAEPKAE